MTGQRKAHIAVIDIGKTNVKLALVDLVSRTELAVETQANRVLPGPPWPHFDVATQWAFLRGALARAQARHPIDGIVVTTHGACAALLDRSGALAAPVLDYEHPGPEATGAAYDALRPPFEQTGSPALPLGLNLGAQLFWQLQTEPGLAQRVHQVVTWPQYWAYLLTGQTACDVCSLGCHTDLWDPHRGTWSDLPMRLGLADKMAAARKPAEVLGTLLPGLQAETGIQAVPVLCGIHDSNASLLPHLAARDAPFSVVSTGTWVVAMAVGGGPVALDPARDTLINVSAHGMTVPSARFMGGREHDLIRGDAATVATLADADDVVKGAIMLLPSVVPGCGPFPGQTHRWTAPATPGQIEVAMGYYLALMTAECLSLIGADGPTMIEGPFAANPWFLAMLQAATGRVVTPSTDRTGTAVGAALLFDTTIPRLHQSAACHPDSALMRYAAAWRDSRPPDERAHSGHQSNRGRNAAAADPPEAHRRGRSP